MFMFMNWLANHIRWYKIIHYHISTNFTLSSGVRKCQKQFKPEWKTHWGNLYFRQHRHYVRGLLIAFLEGLMLKLKLQHFGHLMGRADSVEKTLMLGKIEGKRRGQQYGWMVSLTQWTWVWVNSGSWWWIGRPGVLWFTGLQRVCCNS